jgi:uncharacterized membrane protein
MSEVCQNGIDGILPSWCVQYDFGINTIFQLALELLFLVVLFMLSYFLFEWRKRKRIEKKQIERIENENQWQPDITTLKYKDEI